MCLGIPGKVISLYQQGSVVMGKVKFGDISKETCMSMVPDVKIDDYVIVHVGFALNIIDEAAAQESAELLKRGLA